MPPAIAGKHSQRVGMLRYFDTILADTHTSRITGPAAHDPADGLLVYFLGDPGAAQHLTIEHNGKPILIATTTEHSTITEAVIEFTAVSRALDRSDVQADRVAKRELQDRTADARRRLLERVATHLHPSADGVQFQLAGTSEKLAVGRGLSNLLSHVCDSVYSASPEVANEMLGRRELTSQAAKARRELLTAMVRNGDQEWLGFEGFGPEKAMYAALLRHSGIHRADDTGRYSYHPPQQASMARAWGTMAMVINAATVKQVPLDVIYDELMAHRLGSKKALYPSCSPPSCFTAPRTSPSTKRGPTNPRSPLTYSKGWSRAPTGSQSNTSSSPPAGQQSSTPSVEAWQSLLASPALPDALQPAAETPPCSTSPAVCSPLCAACRTTRCAHTRSAPQQPPYAMPSSTHANPTN